MRWVANLTQPRGRKLPPFMMHDQRAPIALSADRDRFHWDFQFHLRPDLTSPAARMRE